MAILNVDFTSSGYQQRKQETSELDKRLAKLTIENRKLKKELAGLDKTTADYAKEEARLTKKLVENTVAIKNNKKQMVDLNSATKKQKDSIESLKNQVITGALAFIGFKSAIEATIDIINVGRDFEALQVSINAAVGSVQLGIDSFSFLQQEADRLGTNLQASAKGFKEFSASAKTTNLTIQEQREIFTSVSEASTVMQLSVDDMNGVFKAFSQILSKGTVQSEELRGQIGERLPGAFSIASKAMGVSAQELGKLLEQGKVVSEDFLPKFAKELQKVYGKDILTASQTLTANINRFNNELALTKNAIANSGLNELADKLIKMSTSLIRGVRSITIGFTATDELNNIDDLVIKLEQLNEKREALGDVGSGFFRKTTASDIALIDSQIANLTNRLIKLYSTQEKGGKNITVSAKEASLELQAMLDPVAVIERKYIELQEQIKGTIYDTEKYKKLLEQLKADEINRLKNVEIAWADTVSNAIIKGINGSDLKSILQESFSAIGSSLIQQSISKLLISSSFLTPGYGLAAGIGLSLLSRSGIFGGEGRKTAEEVAEENFKIFRDAVDKFAKSAEQFGNSGTAISESINKTLQEISRYQDILDSDLRKFASPTTTFTGDEFYQTGQFEGRVLQGFGATSAEARQAIATQVEELIKLNIKTFQTGLAEELREVVAQDIDFSVFSEQELKSITGIDNISDFNAKYAEVVKSINQTAIDLKEAQRSGATEEEINDIALSLSELYTSATAVKGSDFEEAIKLLEDFAEAREKEVEAIKNEREALQLEYDLLTGVTTLREQELLALDESNRELQLLINAEEDRLDLVQEQIAAQEELKEKAEQANQSIQDTINRILGISDTTDGDRFLQLSQFNRLLAQYKGGDEDSLTDILSLGASLGQNANLQGGIIRSLESLQTNLTSPVSNYVQDVTVPNSTTSAEGAIAQSTNAQAQATQRQTVSNQELLEKMTEFTEMFKRVSQNGNRLFIEIAG